MVHLSTFDVVHWLFLSLVFASGQYLKCTMTAAMIKVDKLN
jgi:hypothetical protein